MSATSYTVAALPLHLAALQATWAAQEQEATRQPRACRLCTQGLTVDGVRLCGAPEVPRSQHPQPAHVTRQLGGACGPDAALMRTPWLTPQQ